MNSRLKRLKKCYEYFLSKNNLISVQFKTETYNDHKKYYISKNVENNVISNNADNAKDVDYMNKNIFFPTIKFQRYDKKTSPVI